MKRSFSYNKFFSLTIVLTYKLIYWKFSIEILETKIPCLSLRSSLTQKCIYLKVKSISILSYLVLHKSTHLLRCFVVFFSFTYKNCRYKYFVLLFRIIVIMVLLYYWKELHKILLILSNFAILTDTCYIFSILRSLNMYTMTFFFHIKKKTQLGRYLTIFCNVQQQEKSIGSYKVNSRKYAGITLGIV